MVTLCLSLGLSHANNMKKMRLLTIISLAASSSEVTFDQIAQHLNLEEDKIEEFVINGEHRCLLNNRRNDVLDLYLGIRARLIGANINQVEKKVQFT